MRQPVDAPAVTVARRGGKDERDVGRRLGAQITLFQCLDQSFRRAGTDESGCEYGVVRLDELDRVSGADDLVFHATFSMVFASRSMSQLHNLPTTMPSSSSCSSSQGDDLTHRDTICECVEASVDVVEFEFAG